MMKTMTKNKVDLFTYIHVGLVWQFFHFLITLQSNYILIRRSGGPDRTTCEQKDNQTCIIGNRRIYQHMAQFHLEGKYYSPLLANKSTTIPRARQSQFCSRCSKESDFGPSPRFSIRLCLVVDCCVTTLKSTSSSSKMTLEQNGFENMTKS